MRPSAAKAGVFHHFRPVSVPCLLWGTTPAHPPMRSWAARLGVFHGPSAFPVSCSSWRMARRALRVRPSAARVGCFRDLSSVTGERGVSPVSPVVALGRGDSSGASVVRRGTWLQPADCHGPVNAGLGHLSATGRLERRVSTLGCHCSAGRSGVSPLDCHGPVNAGVGPQCHGPVNAGLGPPECLGLARTSRQHPLRVILRPRRLASAPRVPFWPTL